ncbi:uncharacterized protein [Choristoneura fumiferana]|uniref:uncharacterized protein n=1 Tax=Choristoneura fumiferana TaxID=7141 RepID=UPI003D157086
MVMIKKRKQSLEQSSENKVLEPSSNLGGNKTMSIDFMQGYVVIETENQDLGHRIIDFNHFIMELVKLSQHKCSFDYRLAIMKLVSENQVRVGLQSEFSVCS